ncbi:MAG TPA: mandelate racemase/muconate lactonizing enzyme family protein [Chloroflexota bacterium]|nr:mandelate racemase/muconate lactonizing enzyme family protein [Chloroflexota bacterium]
MQIRDVRVRAVHVNHRGNWVFVQVTTDAGLVGTGEASHSTDDRALAALVAALRPRLIGWDPFAIEALFAEIARPNAGMIAWTAFSAIEQALWDVAGQAAGVPVYQLLGGRCVPALRLYANVNRAAANREPAAYAECARQAVEDGFRAVKCAPFDDVSWTTLDHPDGRRAFDRGLERVRRVRAAIGDETELSVDCHNRFDVATARRVARELAPFRLYWLEAPVPPWDPEPLSQVKAGLDTRLAAGEELLGRAAFRPLFERHALDVAMFDVKHTGGLLEGKKIAAMAEAYGIAASPHSPAGPVAHLAAGHLCATLPNFLTLEYAWGEVPWRADLLNGAEQVRDGCLLLPEKPGLGLSLNENVLAEHAVEL